MHEILFSGKNKKNIINLSSYENAQRVLKVKALLIRTHAMFLRREKNCHKNPKYWDWQAWANSVDPDQMPQNAASGQGLHCLQLIQQFFRHINRL